MRARVQGSPEGGQAQEVAELQRASVESRRRLARVERAERDGQQPGEQAQGSEGPESRPPLQPFRQAGIPPEVEREVQERAWRRIKGEAARLEERNSEVAESQRMVREEEGAAARGGHRVIPDPGGGKPPHRYGGTVAVRDKGKRGGGRR